MTEHERIGQLMSEVGPAVGAEEVAAYDASTWAIVFDDRTLVLAELDPSLTFLTLSLDLGPPEPGRKLATYEAALLASYTAPPGEALRIALDGVDGGLVLLRSVPAATLDAPGLQFVLQRVLFHAGPWRDCLAEGGVHRAAPDDEGAGVDSMFGMRV